LRSSPGVAIETVPTSVEPNTLCRWSPNVSIQRSASAAGSADPLELTKRSELTSWRRITSGPSARMRWSWIGTRARPVARCCATARSVSSGSKRRCSTIVPESHCASEMCASPQAWKAGEAMTVVSATRRLRRMSSSENVRRLKDDRPFPERAPLGVPVVPEVSRIERPGRGGCGSGSGGSSASSSSVG
jgi:hypothetical protein